MSSTQGDWAEYCDAGGGCTKPAVRFRVGGRFDYCESCYEDVVRFAFRVIETEAPYLGVGWPIRPSVPWPTTENRGASEQLVACPVCKTPNRVTPDMAAEVVLSVIDPSPDTELLNWLEAQSYPLTLLIQHILKPHGKGLNTIREAIISARKMSEFKHEQKQG